MPLKDKPHHAIAGGTPVGHGDNGHGESFPVLDAVALNRDSRSGHLSRTQPQNPAGGGRVGCVLLGRGGYIRWEGKGVFF